MRSFQLNNEVFDIVKLVFDFEYYLLFASLIHNDLKVETLELIDDNCRLESLVQDWLNVKFVIFGLSLARERSFDLSCHYISCHDAIHA